MPRVVRVCLLILGLGVVALAIRRAGVSDVARMLRRAGPSFLAIAAIYLLQVFVRALALWRTTLDEVVRYRDVLAIRFMGEAVDALASTGPLIAEPSKGWFLGRRGIEPSIAYGAVLAEYLLSIVASAVLAAIALSYLIARQLLPVALQHAAAVLVLLIAAFLVAFSVAAATGTGLIVPSLLAIGRVLRWRAPARAAVGFMPVEDVIIRFLSADRRRVAEVMAVEACAQLLLIGELRVIIAALGFQSSWLASLVVEGGVKFVAIAFAFVPGQLGASEVVYAVLCGAIGLPAAAGVSVALVRRLRSMVVAIAGLTTYALTG